MKLRCMFKYSGMDLLLFIWQQIWTSRKLGCAPDPRSEALVQATFFLLELCSCSPHPPLPWEELVKGV
jgi:hypothetical protein